MNRTVITLLVLAFTASPLLGEEKKSLSKLQEAEPATPAEKAMVDSFASLPNLVQNASFEEGDADNTSPAHWYPVDGLVYKWTTDADSPGHGKIVRIDTDVYQKQAYGWWIERYIHNKPVKDAPKEETTGPKWNTIGGLDGGFYMSDFIPIKKDAAYRVLLDIKGPGCKVFIKGYDKILPMSFADENPAVQELFRHAKNEQLLDENNRPIKYRLRYRYSFWFPAGGSGEWKTYTHERPFNPTGRELTEDVRYIRVMLYPYWPAGTYSFDNIRVVEVPALEGHGKPKADEADIDQGKVIR